MRMATSRKGAGRFPLAAVLPVLAVGGAATVYAHIGQGGATPRTPREVAQHFLNAALVTHKENANAGYICDLNNLDIYDLQWKLNDIQSQEQLVSRVSFHAWQAIEEGLDAHVTVRIDIKFPEAPERSFDEDWKLDLKHSGNWRVCNAHKVVGRA